MYSTARLDPRVCPHLQIGIRVALAVALLRVPLGSMGSQLKPLSIAVCFLVSSTTVGATVERSCWGIFGVLIGAFLSILTVEGLQFSPDLYPMVAAMLTAAIYALPLPTQTQHLATLTLCVKLVPTLDDGIGAFSSASVAAAAVYACCGVMVATALPVSGLESTRASSSVRTASAAAIRNISVL